LFTLLALISPRLALGLLWIFTGQVDQAFESNWVPVVGFVFFPWTTFVYAIVWTAGDVSSGGWVLVALALLADVSSWAAKAHTARSQQRSRH
jgi:hypothetical protein